MSNSTEPFFDSPPLPPSEDISPPSPDNGDQSSPPSLETEQPSASPPPNNNPATPQPPPDNEDTPTSSPPPQSPPPNSDSPPLSPPPQSPPLSPPQSPSSHENTSPPEFRNPQSSPPPERRQDPSPSPPPTSFSPPQSTISPPPTTVQITPPSTETPRPDQGFTSPPQSQSPPIQTLAPPIENPQSPPVQTLSPPTGSPLFGGGDEAVNGTTSTVTTTTLNNGTTSTTTTTSNVTSDDVSVNGGLTKSHIGSIIGGTGAGMLIIVFVVMLFVGRTRKRKKKGAKVFDTQYMPQNKSPDMYNTHSSGPSNAFYTTQAQQYQGTSESNGLGGTKSSFTYEQVMEITNGFSPQNIIGEGGFGCVYKGWLPDGKVVAVKQLKKGSGQGEREFQAEVEIISRVHHRYLVSLVGYCMSENQRLLIYEFVSNGTMEHHMHGKGLPVLEWSKRMKIAVGAARGLAYLHEDCHPKIIHRDIKSANILLDDAFEAQVADFGLAKLTDGTNTHVSTRVMGTFGYMAPEYASSGKLTDRSDVFSFGVVLLELITGRKSVDTTQPLGDESLAEWARPHLARALETGDFSEIVDPRLGKQYVESEMFRMVEAAAACVRHSAPKRPRMMQVARSLDCEGDTTDLSNGVKYGQSTIYDSGQYNQDMNRFRMMAFGSGHSKEFDMNSRDTASITSSWKSGHTSIEYPSGESDTQAMNLQRSFK